MNESDDIFGKDDEESLLAAMLGFPSGIASAPIMWMMASDSGIWLLWLIFALNLWLIYWSGSVLYRVFLKPDSTEQKKSFRRDRKKPSSSEKAHLSEEKISQEGEKKLPSIEPTQTSRSKQKKSNRSQKESDSSEPSNSDCGSVYVLTNPELPDMVKIGHTTRSAAKRAKELSVTGVPGEYEVAHEIHVGHPKQVEKKVHRSLSNQRASKGEFFKVPPEKAARTIKRAAS